MDETKVKNLLKKLDLLVNKQFSEDSTKFHKKGESFGIVITKDLNINNLTQNQVIMVHTLLHLFFGANASKEFQKQDLIDLHTEIIKRLKNHRYFDKLDINISK